MDEVYEKQGWLWKKSPTGIRGFRIWQKRWFLITKKSLTYRKEKESKTNTGLIPLSQIIDCKYIPMKRLGCRFDLQVKDNGRVYSLHGAYVEDARSWVAAINKAVSRSNAEPSVPPTSKKLATTPELTKLQQLFARARFGTGIQGQLVEEKPLQKAMEKDFPHERNVLKWILDQTMDPLKKFWIWDYRTDLEISELEVEGKEAPLLKKCGVATCKYYVSIPDCSNCVLHSNNPKLYTEDKEKAQLVEMLRSNDFLRYLLRVFEHNDPEAHGLAVRVLWIVMRGTYERKESLDQFCINLTILCAGDKYNAEIHRALLGILLSDRVYHHEKVFVSFYLPVHHHTAWKVLFSCLAGSPIEIRKTALEDINTILHENSPACISLQRSGNWQEWIFPLLVDIPKEKLQDPKYKPVFAFCINVLTVVHCEMFMTQPTFYNLILNSLQLLYQFGGATGEGQFIASTLLGAMCNKLASLRHTFRPHDLRATEWENIRHLGRVLKKYIFKSAFWNSHVIAEEEEPGSTLLSTSSTISTISNSGAHTRTHATLGPAFFSADSKERCDKDAEESKIDDLEPSLSAAPTYSPSPLSTPDSTGRKKLRQVEMGAFVLQKIRLQGKDQKDFLEEDPADMKDYGLHWNEQGACTDISLCDKFQGLYKALGIDSFSPEQKPTLEKDDKDWYAAAAKEYKWWEDVKKITTVFTRQDIEERKKFTYRRVSFLLQSLLNNKTDVQTTLKEIQRYLAKDSATTSYISEPSVSSASTLRE